MGSKQLVLCLKVFLIQFLQNNTSWVCEAWSGYPHSLGWQEEVFLPLRPVVFGSRSKLLGMQCKTLILYCWMASINGASYVQGCCFFPLSIQEEIFSVMQNRFSNILYHRCSPVPICRVLFSQLNQTTCSISVKDWWGYWRNWWFICNCTLPLIEVKSSSIRELSRGIDVCAAYHLFDYHL